MKGYDKVIYDVDKRGTNFFRQNRKDKHYMEERVHKTMTWTGALNIAVGIIGIVIGLAGGILLIVSGSKLLSDRNKLLF